MSECKHEHTKEVELAAGRDQPGLTDPKPAGGVYGGYYRIYAQVCLDCRVLLIQEERK